MRGNRSSRGVTVTDGSVSDVYRPAPATPRVYVVSDVRLYRDGLVAGLAPPGIACGRLCGS